MVPRFLLQMWPHLGTADLEHAERAALYDLFHVAIRVVAERLPLSPRERLPVPRPILRIRVEHPVGVGPEPVAR